MTSHESEDVLGIPEIQSYQQNRFPTLFIDRITFVDPGVRACGFKNFTYNEWFFPAHFPGDPNVPGFILIEAATQVFLMTFLTLPENKGMVTNFLSVDTFKFKKKVTPGDRLDIEAHLLDFRRGIAAGTIEGYLGDQLALTGNIKVAIPLIMGEYTNPMRQVEDKDS